MKVNSGTMDTTLLRNKTKKIVRSKRTEVQDANITSWNTSVAALDILSTAQRMVQTTQRCSEERVAHIEELQMQVTAGIYKVDSMLLAQSMLTDQTHFLDENWD
jgi:anti-sigma28 factor (negative regulator of flagellin synthesis)